MKFLIGSGNAEDDSKDFTIVCTMFGSTDPPPPLTERTEFTVDFRLKAPPLTSRHLLLPKNAIPSHPSLLTD
jgi:hypothetical protein